MLEILALWALTNRIGNIVEQKERRSGWYKVLTVVLWFGGEIIGAILGAIVTGGEESECLIYLFALLGAAVGAGIAYLIANSLSPIGPSMPTPPSTPMEAVRSPDVGGNNVVKKGLKVIGLAIACAIAFAIVGTIVGGIACGTVGALISISVRSDPGPVYPPLEEGLVWALVLGAPLGAIVGAIVGVIVGVITSVIRPLKTRSHSIRKFE